jgi:hypothetical protein
LAETGGFTTGGAVSAPIAGRIIARIAPFLGVRRIAAEGDVSATKANLDKIDPAMLTANQ